MNKEDDGCTVHSPVVSPRATSTLWDPRKVGYLPSALHLPYSYSINLLRLGSIDIRVLPECACQ